jgi:hypothetical protein
MRGGERTDLVRQAANLRQSRAEGSIRKMATMGRPLLADCVEKLENRGDPKILQM